MDLADYVQSHWSKLGSKLAGKLRVYVGDDDTFFLNNGVAAFQDVVDRLRGPSADARFRYGKDAPHCWGPWGPRLVQMMADEMYANAPRAGDVSWWRPGAAIGPATRSSVEPYGRRGHGV
jgi:hypothetical protein